MADNKPAKAPRRIRKVETVRQRAEKAGTTGTKPRRLNRTAGHITRPIKGVARFARREVHLPGARANPNSFLHRRVRFVPRFFIDAWAELRQVTWPTKSETIRLTLAVIIFAVIFGLVIALVDAGLGNIFRKLLVS